MADHLDTYSRKRELGFVARMATPVRATWRHRGGCVLR